MASYPCANLDAAEEGHTNTCNKCNVCDSCNAGIDGKYKTPLCNTAQTVCMIDQSAKSYVDMSFPSGLKDEPIIKKFPQAKLNEIIDWVNKVSKIGLESTSPQQSVGHESGDFLTAEKINELVQAIKNIYSGNSANSVSKDQVVYGDDFQQLLNAIHNLKLNPSKTAGVGACDTCVAECNVHCDNCNDCFTCQGSDNNNAVTTGKPGNNMYPGTNPYYCVSCQACNSCNDCVACNSVDHGVPTPCNSCNFCEFCNTCENHNTCTSMAEYAACNICQYCQSCLYCESCQSCQKCNTLQTG